MHPVQHFKANFDKSPKDEPTITSLAVAPSNGFQLHEAESGVRNICFVWEDGRKAFFNYAYLIATEFEPHADRNHITLTFSSYQIRLSGYHLEPLFMALLDHLPRVVSTIDARYAQADETQTPKVLEIKVTTDS